MDTQLPTPRGTNRAQRARIVHRILVGTIGFLIAVAVVSVVVAYAVSEAKINKTYQVEQSLLSLQTVPADPGRGERLVLGILRCTQCHERDLGGKIVVDTEIGRVVAPNLTGGRGGLGKTLSDAQWVSALRHGIGRDGKGLWMMPTSRFRYMDDADIGDVIAFLRSLPPVDREPDVSYLGLLGRLVHAMGKLELISAQETRMESTDGVRSSTKQGRHLSQLGGCATCHATEADGDEEMHAAGDLVRGAFRAWTYEDFLKAMRQGIRPDGEPMSDDMPWPEVGRLNDVELRALFDYLRSLGSAG
jgi:mono/diheme cytochrome c family protein